MVRDRLELLAELFDDFQHPVAIKNRRGFRQTAKGRAGDAELLLHLLEFAGLLQGPQGRTDGIEHVQQQQRDVLIHVQDSIARTISLAPDVTKRLEYFGNHLEILEALEFMFLYFMPLFAHQRHLNRNVHRARV